MWWIALGVVLFILFLLGKRNLQIYTISGSGLKEWEDYKLPLIVWTIVVLIAFAPIVNLIAFILWFTIFSTKLSVCNRKSGDVYLDDMRVAPGKRNWIGTLVKIFSKRY